MDVQPADWTQLFNYGVPTAILVMVLWAIWKLGSKLTEATTESMRRQADSGERTANAVNRISESTEKIGRVIDTTNTNMTRIDNSVERSRLALKSIVLAIYDLTPDDKKTVKRHLEDAHNHLK